MIIAECHPARKAQARGLCKSCYDKWLKATNASYKAAQLSNTTAWAKKNPEKMKLIQQRRVARDKAHPDYAQKQRTRTLKKYGLTIDSYAALLDKQNNACALCYRKPNKTKFHVDHSHATGKVRGILCHQCNWYLGVVDADPAVLTRIALYREGK